MVVFWSVFSVKSGSLSPTLRAATTCRRAALAGALLARNALTLQWLADNILGNGVDGIVEFYRRNEVSVVLWCKGLRGFCDHCSVALRMHFTAQRDGVQCSA